MLLLLPQLVVLLFDPVDESGAGTGSDDPGTAGDVVLLGEYVGLPANWNW